MGRQVPLVIYNGGVRTVIGTADVEDDGLVHCTVDTPFDRRIFGTHFEDLAISVSIMPMPPLKSPELIHWEEETPQDIRISEKPEPLLMAKIPPRGPIIFQKKLHEYPLDDLPEPQKQPLFDIDRGEPNGQ